MVDLKLGSLLIFDSFFKANFSDFDQSDSTMSGANAETSKNPAMTDSTQSMEAASSSQDQSSPEQEQGLVRSSQSSSSLSDHREFGGPEENFESYGDNEDVEYER